MKNIKRSVIQIANSTQLVSLPRKWALRNSLKKGDDIDVREEGSKLIITRDGRGDIESTTLHLETADKIAKHSINLLYRYGYDEVEVEYDDPKAVDALQESLNELLGFEIVSQSNKRCVIKSIAVSSDMDFDNVLRRLFIMVNSMIKDTYEAIRTNDWAMLAKVNQIDAVVNKFSNFCQRLLNKSGYKEFRKTSMIYYIVCSLEQLADEYKRMCTYTLKNRKKALPKGIVEVCRQVSEYFDEFYMTFYKDDPSKRFDVKQKMVRITSDIEKIIESKTGVEASIAGHLYNVMSITKHMAGMII